MITTTKKITASGQKLVWAEDGNCWVEEEIIAPCGAVAYFDFLSGCSYRCYNCLAVIGSIGMPDRCRQIMKDNELVEALKGKEHERGKLRVHP